MVLTPKGKLKVVALDPNDPDSSAIIQSSAIHS
jgi:hypothetical protein